MPAKPTNPEYERQRMAEIIAEITSGVKNAIPEQDDFDTAAKPTNPEYERQRMAEIIAEIRRVSLPKLV